MSGPPDQPKRSQQVYTLLVEVGRRKGDGLPEGSTGAALLCYSSGVSEDEAVRECVAVLKKADMAPLDVTGYGTIMDRQSAGQQVDAEERALMDRALKDNAVVVVRATPFYDESDRDRLLS